jgi:hypothetical protein
MIVSATTIARQFCTYSPTTGALANADSLPTGTLTVNGVDNAATVTVTNVTTGVYKWSVTLPALTAGDLVAMRIAATVSSVSSGGIVWQDYCDRLTPPNFSALGIGTSGTLTGTVNADAIKINGSADAASALGSAGGIAYNNNNRFPVDVYSLNGMVIGGTDGTVATATVSSFTVSGTDLTADIMPGTLVGFTGRGYRVVTGVTYDGDTTVTIAPPLTSAPSPGDAFVIVELPSPTLNSNGSVIGGGGDINNVTVEITETRAS